MNPFLSQVAHHYHPAPDFSRMCFIFPNKRSISFFLKYIGEESARMNKATIAPECLTINDFFAKVGGLRPADSMTSMLTLYDCYKDLYHEAEPLDEFLFWGGVILSDFSEVDKYLVKPEHIFRNIADYRQIQDSFDYLEPEQRNALERFLKQFGDRKLYKERFRRIWDMLLPLYNAFNSRLQSEGMVSEGAVYRRISDRLDSESVVDILSATFPDTAKYVFVGLNALNACEKKVLRKMRDAALAEFCWDWSSSEIKDPANRSSFFLSKNVEEFKQAFDPDPDGLPRPVINVVSVPSSVGQAKLLPGILSSLVAAGLPSQGHCHPRHIGGTTSVVGSSDCETAGEGSPAANIGINTAIVLPDEGLLLPVLNSIPEEIEDVNVTMGYPMRGSEFHALLTGIAVLQQNSRERNGVTQFYHKHVRGIFSNSIIRSILSEEGKEILSRIRKDARYYISQESFRGDPLLETIFRPAADILAYQRGLLLCIAPMLKSIPGMQMELDFAMFAYKAVTRLGTLKLDVQPRTMWKLLDQLIGRTAIPFKGEPLKGMQIMGPLETRALDFDNLIILSCNEGMFPRRSVAASFIPAELRKGFNLPTYEYQDSVWAYYFYRLIQRAENVWLLFDSRTELSRSGEESRYIRQLQMLYDFEVRRHIVKAPLRDTGNEEAIVKTDEDLEVMAGKDFTLSASRLQDYLACPAKFYYSKIKGLEPAEEVSESLDAGMMGTVLHESMQTLYGGRDQISRDYIKGLLAEKDRIRSVVSSKIMDELHSDVVEGRNLVFEELVCRYVQKILETDLSFLRTYGKSSFRILGLERKKEKTIDGFRFKGYIDRLDSFDEGSVRIVDYKTGKVEKEDIDINDANADKIVAKLFGGNNKDRPKIALQLYLYDVLMDGDPAARGKRTLNCIYQTTSIFVEQPLEIPRSEVFSSLMEERLSALLSEIRDKGTPWRRTDDVDTCKYCDFKTICGK